jgi:hypothetical protein
MKTTIRKKLYAIIAVCMFAGMMGLSVNTSIQGVDVNIFGIHALASGSTGVYDNMELADHTCWNTGGTILRCKHGNYICDAGDQGTC